MSGWLLLILALNFGISWWNAYACGRAWVEANAVGGVIKLLVWCGAIQSTIGFSSVFLFPMIFVTHWAVPEYFTEVHVNGAVNLWYISIIFPALGTGFIITIHSWIAAYRERSLLNMGTAAWNTFAQVHNTMGAINNLGPAFKAVGEMFGSLTKGDSKDKGAVIGVILVVMLVILALLAGAILTAVLIKRYSGTIPLPVRNQRQVA